MIFPYFCQNVNSKGPGSVQKENVRALLCLKTSPVVKLIRDDPLICAINAVSEKS